jgi:hypothetical protein
MRCKFLIVQYRYDIEILIYNHGKVCTARFEITV